MIGIHAHDFWDYEAAGQAGRIDKIF